MIQKRVRKIALCVAAVYALMSSVALAKEDPHPANQTQELVKQGYRFWQEGNVAKARGHLEYALQLQPKDYRLLELKGHLNAQQGDYEQAVEDLKLAAVYAQTQGNDATGKRLYAKAMEFQTMIDSYAKRQAERAKALAAEAQARAQAQEQAQAQAQAQARAQVAAKKVQIH